MISITLKLPSFPYCLGSIFFCNFKYHGEKFFFTSMWSSVVFAHKKYSITLKKNILFRNIEIVPTLTDSVVSSGTARHGKQIVPGPIWYFMTNTVTDYSAIFSISYTSKLFLLLVGPNKSFLSSCSVKQLIYW